MIQAGPWTRRSGVGSALGLYAFGPEQAFGHEAGHENQEACSWRQPGEQVAPDDSRER
jgi:hypothetical protein